MLSAGKIEECYIAAQKIMESSKYLVESSYWFNFEFFVVLAEIFGEFCRR